MNNTNHSLNQLNWRYATKMFDTTKKITAEQLEIVIESLRLSPSSYGLQGWKFIRVVDQTKRQTLKEAAYGQSQVTNASEFFILTIPTNFSETNIDKFIESTAKTRNMPVEQLSKFKDMLKSTLANQTAEQTASWLKMQLYIALGQAMAVCAIENIDTCPMEGFDHAKFDEILDLKSKNLTSVVCLAVGFRSAEDKYAQLAKVRFSEEEMLLTI